MSEIMKDIKLFGKTITLFPDKVVSDDSVSEHRYCSFTASTSNDSKDEYSLTRSGHEYESIDPTEDVQTSIDMDDDTESPTKEESGENNQEKTLKKPDKVLPCPRCASMDTKFCYYNNYNVKQPRHFCKNCQRYWTSGGTMRNVPVGSGRRKNKNTALSSFHHIMVSDTLQSGFIIGHSSSFPVSFYPAGTAYWNVPLVSPAGGLGKHSREGKLVGTSKDSEDVERSVLIPKTLRIDDPNEAAKSSIWSTLGMKQAKNGGGIFRAFESKGDRIIDNTAMVLQANPAALSRSLNFHERA